MLSIAEKIIFLCIVLTGICLRFYGLDTRVYWYDEAYTSLEISGFSPHEASADILTGRVVSKEDLEKYQFPDANSQKSVRDTVKGLITSEPQLTPSYFVMLRWWSLLFPQSIGAIRALSAIWSIIALTSAFWLCRTMFPSAPRIAYFGVALMAVSPLHVMYAQEARPYAMWTAASLLSCVALLIAMRRQTIRAWAIYAVCAAISLYTFLLSLLLLAAQSVYVASESRFHITRTVKAFAVAALSALFSFAFWPYRGQSGSGNEHSSIVQYALKSLRSLAVLFADFDLSSGSSKRALIPYALLLAALLALCCYAAYFLWRRAGRSQAVFILLLVASVWMPLLTLDAAKGTSVSLVTRYIFPSLIGVQLAVAHLFAKKTDVAIAGRGRVMWQACAVLVLGLGLASSVSMARAEVWWNKDPDNYVQSVSRAINAAKDPVVVITDAWFVRMFSLEHKLRPEVHYQLTVEPNLPHVDRRVESVFVVGPSARLRAALGKCFSFKLLGDSTDVWELRRVVASCDVP